MNLTPWLWALLPLGVCRATQIVLFDRVSEAPRRWLLERLNPHDYEVDDPRRPYFSVLFSCVWCMSTWLGAIAVALVAWDSTRAGALFVLAALSLSLLAVGIDRAFDRWLPDEVSPVLTITRDGVTYTDTRPPTEVADALEAAERAAVR